MSYFKQKHTQWIILSFLLASVLLFLYPNVDLQVSKVFYYDGFYQKGVWWEYIFYDSVQYFLSFTLLVVVGLWATNRYLKKHWCGICGRKALYVTFVLIIGSGFIVNTVLKEGFGRPRPRDIIEFNGAKHFQPAFVISGECMTNCSFSSGHGSGAFLAIALAFLFKRRQTALFAALSYGALVSLSRIAAGAHFFSDSVISFFIMLITADILYHYMFLRETQLNRDHLNLSGLPDGNKY